jgi:putative spermidine/putrescine transport system ATP-binding protein
VGKKIMSLELQKLSYQYPGTTQGVHSLSLAMKQGELLAVIGPSGSGKSTLLKLISGLTTGYSGAIILNGKDISKLAVHERNLGMVFQNYALFPHLNVLDNIAYGLKLRGLAKPERHKRAMELLDTIDMRDFAQRAVSQLSGGQQQRVALARALAINPSALLLDEPLAALDASIRGHLRDQICQLQRRYQATTLLVTHDQEEALSMADRVAMLKDGHLLQLATPQEIYAAPASKAVAEFVGLSTILPARVCGINEIDVGFARLQAPTSQRSSGQKIYALIRPEHVQVDPDSSALNQLKGRTTAVRFLGSLSRFDFSVAGCVTPILAEAATAARETIAIAPQHIHLLDE